MTNPFIDLTYDCAKTERHAFRVQAARCHEFILYREKMSLKYPMEPPTTHDIVDSNIQFERFSKWQMNMAKRLENSPLTKIEQNELLTKHQRMLEAKRVFEKLTTMRRKKNSENMFGTLLEDYEKYRA